MDSGHPVFGNYQAIPDTGCAGLDQDVELAGLDIDQVLAAADNDLFCSLEEEVSDSGHAVFPKARVARMECDTVHAPPHDHVGSVAEYYWLWLRR